MGSKAVELKFIKQNLSENEQLDGSLLARALKSSGIMYHDQKKGIVAFRDYDEIEVDLREATGINLAELARLALIIRRYADRGAVVKLTLPHTNSGFRERLERLDYPQLFNPIGEREPWQERVVFKKSQRPKETENKYQQYAKSRFIPFNWIDKKTYVKGSVDGQLRPVFESIVYAQFTRILNEIGFGSNESISFIANTLLYELASNVVKHSGERTHSGVGICGGEVLLKGNGVLEFTVTDIGRGFAGTLVQRYTEVSNKGEYVGNPIFGPDANLIRFAFSDHGSSGHLFSSKVDEFAKRGLPTVAVSLPKSAEMAIASGNGRISIRKGEDLKYDLAEKAWKDAMPGVSANIRIPNNAAETTKFAVTNDALPLHQMEIAHLCGNHGDATYLRSQEAANDWAGKNSSKLGSTKPIVLLDFGYQDFGARSIGYILASAEKSAVGKAVILWNLKEPSPEVIAYLSSESLPSSFPIVLWINYKGECFGRCQTWVGGARKGSAGNLLHEFIKRKGGAIGQLSLAQPVEMQTANLDLLNLANHVNSSLLVEGFSSSQKETGFYQGSIHLLSGKRVRHFFALSVHTRNDDNGNIRRWADAAGLAFHYLVKQCLPGNDVVLVALTSATRSVAQKLAQNMRLYLKDAIMLLAYDLPSLEEFSKFIKEGGNVVLLTDVISSGSLTNGAYELLNKSGVKNYGLICLVNATGRTDVIYENKQNSRMNYVLNCSRLPVELGNSSNRKKSQEYWIDPVALIPSDYLPNEALTRDYLIDAERTIEVLSKTNSVITGHIVDGARHMSAYVDIDKLICDAKTEVADRIKEIWSKRGKQQGWSGFAAKQIVIPLGINRLESLFVNTSADSPPIYPTGAPGVASLLQIMWGGDIIEVPRHFDPSGRARCAELTGILTSLNVSIAEDVIVADDGMWRGTTMTDLVKQALDNGARRVLVIPLLARMQADERDYWESLRTIETHKGVSGRVMFLFPYYLPIPYYSSADCPYCITKHRLFDRQRSFGLAGTLPECLEERLKALRPRDRQLRTFSYTKYWLLCRSYCELAGDSPQTIEKLRDILDEMRTMRAEVALGTEPLWEKEEAVISLFLEEWGLLTRSRIRQALAEHVCTIARRIARDESADIKVRGASVSLLRSRFPFAFIEELPHLTKALARDREFFSRCLFHLETLPQDLFIGGGVEVFLSSLVEDVAKDLKTADKDDVMTKLLYRAKTIALLRATTGNADLSAPVTRARELMRLLEGESSEQRVGHKLQGEVLQLASLEKIVAQEKSLEHWQHRAEVWKGDHNVIFTDRFYPSLKALKNCLLRAHRSVNSLPSVAAEYLTDESIVGRTFNLRTDVAQIGSCLTLLANNIQNETVIKELRVASSQIHEYCVGTTSHLYRLLSSLRTVTLGGFVKKLDYGIRARLEGRFSPRAIEIKVRIASLENEYLFCEAEVMERIKDYLVSNLDEHAYSENTGSERKEIGIVVREESSPQHVRLATIEVLNNGNALKGDLLEGKACKYLRPDLEIFGGQVMPPLFTDEESYRVKHTFILPLWGGNL